MFHQHVGAKPPKRPADAAAGGAAPAKRAKTSIDEKRSEIEQHLATIGSITSIDLTDIEHHLETIVTFIRKIKGPETLEKLTALEQKLADIAGVVFEVEKLKALEDQLYEIFEGIHEGFNPRHPNCAGCNRPGGPAPGQRDHMGPHGCLGSSCDDSSSDEDEQTE